MGHGKKVHYKSRGRHLLLVESTHPDDDNYISKEEIAAAKYDNVDVVYVIRENMWTTLDTIHDFKTKWASVNLLFHGNADSADNSISVFGVKMSMNRDIMMDDKNVINFNKYMKELSRYTTNSIYIYCCAIGFADGLKELCNKLHKKCELSEGIFVSTDATGNGDGENWDVEWGSKYGFLTKGLNDNVIQHAMKDLFKDISSLTFELKKKGKKPTPTPTPTPTPYGFSNAAIQKAGYGQIITDKTNYYVVCNLSSTGNISWVFPNNGTQTDTDHVVHCVPIQLVKQYKSSAGKLCVAKHTFPDKVYKDAIGVIHATFASGRTEFTYNGKHGILNNCYPYCYRTNDTNLIPEQNYWYWLQKGDKLKINIVNDTDWTRVISTKNDPINTNVYDVANNNAPPLNYNTNNIQTLRVLDNSYSYVYFDPFTRITNKMTKLKTFDLTKISLYAVTYPSNPAYITKCPLRVTFDDGTDRNTAIFPLNITPYCDQ
jgi:hypothetical protein